MTAVTLDSLPLGDSVFLEREDERVEYVLTQHGHIYQGSKNFIYSIPWNFGQVSSSLDLPPSFGQEPFVPVQYNLPVCQLVGDGYS